VWKGSIVSDTICTIKRLRAILTGCKFYKGVNLGIAKEGIPFLIRYKKNDNIQCNTRMKFAKGGRRG